MTPQQFNRKGLTYGDKVEVGLRYSYRPKDKVQKTTAFFKGFRILCNAYVSDGYDTLVPVFVKPTSKGHMGRVHYGNKEGEIHPWFENIVSVRKIKEQ